MGKNQPSSVDRRRGRVNHLTTLDKPRGDIDTREDPEAKLGFTALLPAHQSVVFEFKTGGGRLKHTVVGPIQDADLRGINLSGVSCIECDLCRVCFDGALLTSADFSDSYLRNATFRDAVLEGARFDSVDAVAASFASADLYAASFHFANLREANFRNAIARGADFFAAVLPRADLRNADLSADNLGGSTNLQDADLSHAKLSGAKLIGAEYNAATRLPSGFDPEAVGMRKR